jgi:hypothetical protein
VFLSTVSNVTSIPVSYMNVTSVSNSTSTSRRLMRDHVTQTLSIHHGSHDPYTAQHNIRSAAITLSKTETSGCVLSYSVYVPSSAALGFVSGTDLYSTTQSNLIESVKSGAFKEKLVETAARVSNSIASSVFTSNISTAVSTITTPTYITYTKSPTYKPSYQPSTAPLGISSVNQSSKPTIALSVGAKAGIAVAGFVIIILCCLTRHIFCKDITKSITQEIVNSGPQQQQQQQVVHVAEEADGLGLDVSRSVEFTLGQDP